MLYSTYIERRVPSSHSSPLPEKTDSVPVDDDNDDDDDDDDDGPTKRIVQSPVAVCTVFSASSGYQQDRSANVVCHLPTDSQGAFPIATQSKQSQRETPDTAEDKIAKA